MECTETRAKRKAQVRDSVQILLKKKKKKRQKGLASQWHTQGRVAGAASSLSGVKGAPSASCWCERLMKLLFRFKSMDVRFKLVRIWHVSFKKHYIPHRSKFGKLQLIQLAPDTHRTWVNAFCLRVEFKNKKYSWGCGMVRAHSGVFGVSYFCI